MTYITKVRVSFGDHMNDDALEVDRFFRRYYQAPPPPLPPFF